ncbi:MAG: dihydropteroate synthase [Burkholderiales bacterium]
MTRPGELICGKFTLKLDRPLIMGIVNVTPDSFSDGGKFFSRDRAIEYGVKLIEDGADLLDIGGESTRPGSMPVNLDDELLRVIPVIEALRDKNIPLSIDTQKTAVMDAAINAGASMINDVNALRAEGALDVAAGSGAGVCLMHMIGTPQTMQQLIDYNDVLAEVVAFLQMRARAAEQAGIAKDRIVLDPGFGFGKRTIHNLALLRGLENIAALGYPVLAGLSRKSIFGDITGKPAAERIYASIAAAVLAAQNGASIIRVHDVAATRDALAVLQAVQAKN